MEGQLTEKQDTEVRRDVPEVILMAITPDGEDVIERACRTCYLSFDRYDPPASTDVLIRKVIRKGHHSVLEHASATFRIKGASRVFTHEMVRHRLMSPSQESQRYVHYGSRKPFEVVLPESVADGGFEEKYLGMSGECYRLYQEMVDAGVPKEDARYILPGGITSEIVVTANFRELRHIFSIRCVERAHWEIRRICLDMLKIMKNEAPIVFRDFKIDEEKGVAFRVDEEGS
jgi:thymidylate synthase (FAD)